MNNYTALVFTILFGFYATAQKQKNQWRFGVQ